MKALFSPKVWMIGGFFFFALTCAYAYNFSIPAILQGATGWSVTQVGYTVAIFGLFGAVSMIANSEHSDRTGERSLHCVVPCLLMGAAFLVSSYARQPWVVIVSLGCSFASFTAILCPALALPTQFLAGRACAAGIAAMNTITMFSGFVGPYWMGVMKDVTGTYQQGLRGLVLPSLAAAGTMYLLTRSLRRRESVNLHVVSEAAS